MHGMTLREMDRTVDAVCVLCTEHSLNGVGIIRLHNVQTKKKEPSQNVEVLRRLLLFMIIRFLWTDIRDPFHAATKQQTL